MKNKSVTLAGGAVWKRSDSAGDLLLGDTNPVASPESCAVEPLCGGIDLAVGVSPRSSGPGKDRSRVAAAHEFGKGCRRYAALMSRGEAHRGLTPTAQTDGALRAGPGSNRI